MPRRPNKLPIKGKHYTWHLFCRGGVYYADGRANRPNLGKHSLGTRDETEALSRLAELDQQKALENGMIEAIPRNDTMKCVTIVEGWNKYLDYCGRSPVLLGVTPGTLKRYRNARDRHLVYCSRNSVQAWGDFDKSKFEAYANHLFKEYAHSTCYVDLTLIKSVVKWLVQEQLVGANARIDYPLRKIHESTAYCYQPNEVRRMIDYCGSVPELNWLKHVIVVLSHLGLRFGELVDLRWSDIDFHGKSVRIADERSSKKKSRVGSARSTKNWRSRNIPLHPQLQAMLVALPKTSDGRVVHSARGFRLRESNSLNIYKKHVLEALKEEFPTAPDELGFADGTFHSFRHFFASQCLISGASEGEVREWLGHRDSKIVERYRHLRSEDAQWRMSQIDFLRQDDDPQRPGKTA